MNYIEGKEENGYCGWIIEVVIGLDRGVGGCIGGGVK
jgi:hypothetical protein